MFKAIIFDWDGTLADSKKANVKSFKKVLAEVGCIVDDEFIERRIGIGARRTIEEILKENSIMFDDEMIENLIRKLINLQTNLSGMVNLFEGVTDLLDKLHGRIKIALSTMNNRRTVNKQLSEKGIKKYFDIVVTADDVCKPKPDPEIFLVTAMKLNVDPEDCIVVEDSIFGVKAAKAAGMKCIAVTSGAYTREELRNENPDMIVDSVVEIEKVLNFISVNAKGK